MNMFCRGTIALAYTSINIIQARSPESQCIITLVGTKAAKLDIGGFCTAFSLRQCSDEEQENSLYGIPVGVHSRSSPASTVLQPLCTRTCPEVQTTMTIHHRTSTAPSHPSALRRRGLLREVGCHLLPVGEIVRAPPESLVVD